MVDVIKENQSRREEKPVAVVTGANRGIGRAVAVEFARQGCAVLVGARSQEKAAETIAEIEALGGEAISITCDVTKYTDLEHAVERAFDSYGRLDFLINNAGIIEPMSLFKDSDPVEWEANIKTNLLGVYNGCRAALPRLEEAGRGVIVNVSSGAAHRPLEQWSAYCSGKAAVAMLTRCIALESKDTGVYVYGFQPAVVDTGMQAQIRQRRVNEISDLPKEALLDPSIPAKVIVKLCTEAPPDLSGQDLSIRNRDFLKRLGMEDVMA